MQTKCKIIDCFHLTMFISFSAKKLMRKKSNQAVQTLEELNRLIALRKQNVSSTASYIKRIKLFLFLSYNKQLITALFNNLRTLKFKAQPTNVFFATLNQMFGGFSQFLTTLVKSLYTVQTTKQCSAVIVSWEGPTNI